MSTTFLHDLEDLRSNFSASYVDKLRSGNLIDWCVKRKLFLLADNLHKIDLDSTDLALFFELVNILGIGSDDKVLNLFATSSHACHRVPEELDGAIFIQCQKYGVASYHFANFLGSYINYENFQNIRLDDGSPYPKQKYFSQLAWDDESRMLHAVIDWGVDRVTTNNGASEWRYIMQFDADFSRIVSGSIAMINPNGKVLAINQYPMGECVLNYTRYYE